MKTIALILAAGLALGGVAQAQTPIDQATLDAAHAGCAKHLLAPDGRQILGSGPGQKPTRFEPVWEPICEPVWQEWTKRDIAKRAADEAANPDLAAARAAARALGAGQ